jgi:heme/copper-type cytochrome/quinol oxidase subunit 2
VTALLAAHFLAGSLLTLLIPIALVVLVVVYWSVLLHRSDRGKSE